MVLTVLGKYTIPAIKLILILLQNVQKNAMGCTWDISSVLASIGILAITKKKIKNLFKNMLFKLIYWLIYLGL